jgi:hypothetical protein
VSTNKSFKSLSPARQRLVLLMAEYQFGAIVGLNVRGAEPDFSRSCTIYRRHHLGPSKERHVAKLRADFALKAAHIELFDLCDQLVNFEVAELKFEGGLPLSVTTAEDTEV